MIFMHFLFPFGSFESEFGWFRLSDLCCQASQDRSYLRSPLLWEALPRGHAEIRWEDEMVCEVAGLRKFGSAEEKFGPLAREAGGARSLTKRLQGALVMAPETSWARPRSCLTDLFSMEMPIFQHFFLVKDESK